MTQNRDRKQAIRARMAETGEPYAEASRHVGARPRSESVWLNPPRRDDPLEDIIVYLHPAAAAVVADGLAEAAEWARRDGDAETARVLEHTADDIEAASVVPAEADRAGLSREATWHPANIMQRVTPAAVRNAARYLGPSYVASLAIKASAAIAWSAGGQAAKDEVLEHCRWAVESAAAESYPERSGPGKPWFDPAPPATAARAARRKKLGLPSGKDGRASS